MLQNATFTLILQQITRCVGYRNSLHQLLMSILMRSDQQYNQGKVESSQMSIVGSINFGPWACHLALGKILSFAWGFPMILCGMSNYGLGFLQLKSQLVSCKLGTW